ncbi:phosphonate metabolism transcriptional regulator PhnF [Bosea sp. AAP35]|uniref:phosphonate metabolism transcriptional regulator PhnF n=1 Tax=Bosea sp. AAP35 TaxID=1523417 RepID=UPI0012E1F1C8|nr:phosphonate metabolism transcriptional regulator PhnF [Bosea sp. AAP35]
MTDVKAMRDVAPEAGSAEPGTAWRRIADELAAAIAGGAYAAGDTLPAATVLADQHGVHRHTVRQAFRHLAEQGLVTVSRGRGTQVSARRVPYPLGRRVSLRANLGRIGLVGSGSILSQQQIVGEPETCAALGLEPGAALWRLESLSRADGTPMGTGTHWLSVARFPGFDAAYREAEGSMTAALKAYGIADYVRLSTRLTARLASEREADLLHIEPGAAVMVSLAVDALPDLTPIHLVSSVFAGERMEMVVEPFAE